MFKEPFVYQTECLTALALARANGAENGLAVMASGLGKTVMSALDAKARLTEKDGRLLYTCHQNIILEQACDTFRDILGDGRRYAFYNGFERNIYRADTVFASLQTLQKTFRQFRPDEFSHVIVDESHHSHAPKYFGPVEYFRPGWKLGLTATPDRCDGQNIRSIFGNELYNLPLEEALARNLVTPVDYRPMTEELSLDGIERSDISIDDINDRIFLRRRDEEIAATIARHTLEMEDPRTIVFAPSIFRAEELVKSIPGSVTFHSKVPQKERLVRLELFRLGMIRTIITVDCFNEGVDIPEANIIVFLRSTASPTIFFQQLGRGLRRFEGKKKVIVLDFVANCERITALRDFTDVVEQRRKLHEATPHSSTPASSASDDSGEKHTAGAFSIAFDEKVVKVLDIIKRIRPTRIADVPELSSEYSSRNTHSASHLLSKTGRELWWTCAACGLEYQMSARLKLSGKRCPKCEEQVTEYNNLAFAQPELAREYSAKNPVASDKIRLQSRDSVFWNCGECGYVYRARVRSRVHRGDGCPQCASLITFYKSNAAFKLPHLQEEYSDVNILSPNRIHWKSNKAVWWTCKDCGRDWLASIFARSVGQGGCPDCTAKCATPATNIMLTHPHLAEEYSSRNRTPVETVFAATPEKLWWLCSECGRYWESTIRERLDGKRCPACARTAPVAVSK